MLFFRKKLYTGLDVGTGSIKLVQIREGKDLVFDYFVRNVQYTDKNDPTLSQLKEVLGELAQDSKRMNENLVLGIQGTSVITRYIEIPQISQKELDVALPIEAKKFIPFPLEEVSITYKTLPTLSRDSRKMGVTFVGIPKNLLLRIERFFQNFNIKVKTFEPPGFALSRAFKTTKHFRRGETIMMLNIGTKYTNITISRDGGVYFARDIKIGGREFTKSIISPNAPDYAKAEVRKRTNDLFAKSDSFLLIRAVFEDWLKEIIDSMDYYRNYLLDSPQEIDRIVLTGGGAFMLGLADYLNRKIGIPVAMDDDLPGKIETPEKEKAMPKYSPILKFAYGLAMGSMEESS